MSKNIIKTTGNNNIVIGNGNKISRSYITDNFTITGRIDTPNNTIEGKLSNNTMEDIYKMILEKFSKKPILEYKCNNCGGQVELEIDNHIFKCPYCGSVYAIGTNMIYDKGDN